MTSISYPGWAQSSAYRNKTNLASLTSSNQINLTMTPSRNISTAENSENILSTLKHQPSLNAYNFHYFNMTGKKKAFKVFMCVKKTNILFSEK